MRTPKVREGLRLYAIGDIHGCDNLLAEVHQNIADDLIDRPIADYRIIHVGDYGDRGPDTAAVIERLSKLTIADKRVICLTGNHDEMLLDFLYEPEKMGRGFLANGGEATLKSYGVKVSLLAMFIGDRTKLSERLSKAMPTHHLKFFETLKITAKFGDYFFCHAGIRPGISLDRQSRNDLIWIREEFLKSREDFGAVVIHGHTPKDEPEVRANRINIDTGAVYGGPLTCIALEGTTYRFIFDKPTIIAPVILTS